VHIGVPLAVLLTTSVVFPLADSSIPTNLQNRQLRPSEVLTANALDLAKPTEEVEIVTTGRRTIPACALDRRAITDMVRLLKETRRSPVTPTEYAVMTVIFFRTVEGSDHRVRLIRGSGETRNGEELIFFDEVAQLVSSRSFDRLVRGLIRSGCAGLRSW